MGARIVRWWSKNSIDAAAVIRAVRRAHLVLAEEQSRAVLTRRGLSVDDAFYRWWFASTGQIAGALMVEG